MERTVVHLARTNEFAGLAPVGVWRGHEQYYPPQYHGKRGPGHKALDQRPMSASWDEWAHFKAATSPAWRLVEEYSYFPPDAPLDLVYAEVWHRYLETNPAASAAASPADALESVPHGESVTEYTPNLRVVFAESWWLASELVRRHPHLVVLESHPAGGMYDVLEVVDVSPLRVGAMPVSPVQMNRAGRIHVESTDGLLSKVRWSEIIAEGDPHAWVKIIEAQSGLGSPKPAPATTPRSLAYRVLAQILACQVHDRLPWVVRNEFTDSSDPDDHGREHYIDAFPQAVAEQATTERIGIHNEPYNHFWAVLRGSTPVAIISKDGVAYVGDKRIELIREYWANGHKVLPIAAAIIEQAEHLG